VDGPVCALLLPAPLERFILREAAEDLLAAPGVVALEPGRMPYGAFGRLPGRVARNLARRTAGRLARRLGDLRVIAIWHPLQLPLAEALLERHPAAELWYARWDRYEVAHDASPRMRSRLATLHARAAERAALVFAVSEPLVELERAAGRAAELWLPPHEGFPAPGVEETVVAISIGHLGYRTDWGLLRALAERVPELVVLLVGERHDDECRGDPDFAACLALPGLVWLGRQPDEAAARLVACADVGLVPFAREPFNDASLPQRITKYARLGRRTLAPDLAGVRTLARAVTTCATLEDWERELRATAGARARPDLELRAWALAQTAREQNAPLWSRLRALGISPPRP
jgi:hypothetical protein